MFNIFLRFVICVLIWFRKITQLVHLRLISGFASCGCASHGLACSCGFASHGLACSCGFASCGLPCSRGFASHGFACSSGFASRSQPPGSVRQLRLQQPKRSERTAHWAIWRGFRAQRTSQSRCRAITISRVTQKSVRVLPPPTGWDSLLVSLPSAYDQVYRFWLHKRRDVGH